MRFAVLLLAVTISSCNRNSSSANAAAAAPTPIAAAALAPQADDCTLATKLVPGVPGSPGHLIPSEINPNGASELAALMRTFVKDMSAARELVQKSAPVPELWSRHRKMRCSWPTAASDRDEGFDARAQVYLAAVKELDAKPADMTKAFDNVLAACRACHEVSCAGPIEVIDSLRIHQP